MYGIGYDDGQVQERVREDIGTKMSLKPGLNKAGWSTSTGAEYASTLENRKKKVVGEPDAGKPHVRFEVAGDGNQTWWWY
jgi:hypothetical protein